MDAGTVAGAVHLALVSATEAWLEGLRVRGDRRGEGIGRRLIAEGEALARHYGARVLRTALPAHDPAARAVAERVGLRVLAQAVVRELEEATGLPGCADVVRAPALAGDVPVREARLPARPHPWCPQGMVVMEKLL